MWTTEPDSAGPPPEETKRLARVPERVQLIAARLEAVFPDTFRRLLREEHRRAAGVEEGG